MKSKLYCIILFLLFLNSQEAKSQTEGGNKNYIPNITVTAPQAAAINKIGEIPIDASTGKINYNIPIFEIKEGNFTMPINLSYNYSGLLLDETPGYAGVGWTFNIGGAIIHSINGLNDENHETDKTYIHNYINKLAPYNDEATLDGRTTISHFLENVSNGIFDGEPDKYNVSVGNLSCSFYLDKDNSPVFLKNENYKLAGNSTTGFTLTDDKGINYVFNLRQLADKVTDNDQYEYNSSFLITEINFPFTTNKITFEYGAAVQYNDTNLSQSLIKSTNEVGNPDNDFSLRNNTVTTILNTNKLSKIITNSCTIELQYNDNANEPAVTVISNLKVKDKLNNTVENYDFEYTPWVGRRTNLLNVRDNGVVTNTMEYDMSTPYPLPSMNNYYFKKDLWGYYNANANPVNVIGLTDPYANPSIKTHLSSTKIGALTKITYRTKGYSLIDYEPNTVYMKSSDYNFPYDADATTISTIDAATTSNITMTDEDSFTVTTVPLEINIVSVLTNHTSINPYEERTAEVILFKDGQSSTPIYKATQNWQPEGNWIPPQPIFTVTKKIIINEVGTYRLKSNSTKGSSASLGVTLKQRPEYFSQTVGGVRIKQVKNCDFNGECVTTVYNYMQSGNSTGVMLQKPSFYSGYFIQDNLNCLPKLYVKQDYFNYTSIYPLSNFRGSPVLYKTVEKYNTDGGFNNGKTVFTYYGEPSSNSLRDEENYFTTGLLNTETIKNQSDVSLSVQKNTYLNGINRTAPKYVYALECKIILENRVPVGSELGSGCVLLYPRASNNFKSGTFKHESKNYVLQSIENKDYFYGQEIVKTTTNAYDYNTGNLKSQTTNNSKKETLETKYFYAQDAEASGLPFATEMVVKNMVGIPLRTQTFNSSKLTEQVSVYDKSSSTSNLLLPKSVYTGKFPNSLPLVANTIGNVERRVTFDQYDNKGNLLQYTVESGTPVSIIWGYNQTQPIAKIENLLYSTIPSATITNLQTLSNADGDNCMGSGCAEQLLRNGLEAFRNSLPNAFISTYTYNPLVGVTSMTDPKGISSYYEYDNFGRLKFVKDQDLNVLQKYCYNYKGEQIDCSNNSTSVILYKSTARSGSFTKNNCASGGTGSSVSYSQALGAVTSTISQADADTKGLAKFNTDGQANANANGTCTFSSIARSGSFTKNNCASGGVGSSVAFSQAVGAQTSTISQADADSKGLTKFNTDGQANANANGTCTFSSIARSGSFTKNNCTSGGVGSSVAFSQAVGAQTSTISQADADSKGLAKFNTDGQANANANGTCTFSSIARSGSFTRNNCASGGVGSSVAFSQVVGAQTSTISQADADAKGLTKFNTDGQANANANGTCTFSSIARSGSFTRNNCASGGVGSSVAFSQAVGAQTSMISQADADAKGLTKFNTDGQANANANGTCTFSSIARSGSFTRNNCASGGVGSSVAFSQAVGAQTSTISQADADSKGLTLFNTNGQANANANGTCTFSSIARSSSFTRNNCAAGGVGSSVAFSQVAGEQTSTVSQADADSKGLTLFNTNGQANANANGTCTFSSIARSGSFAKNNCASGGVGSSVDYSQGSGASTSTISQADADSKGLAKFNTDGQNNANTAGICTFWSLAKSGVFTRNNCAAGGAPGSITYTVPAGRYSSNTSQAAADDLAQADVNANGQTFANASVTCTFWNTAKNGVFTRNNCALGGSPQSATYTVPAGRYSSNVSQADADSQAQNDINANGQAFANDNNNAKCIFWNSTLSAVIARNNCTFGSTSGNVTYTVPAGRYSSDVSQAAADVQAQTEINNNGQTYANENGLCTFWNTAKSKTANKNDCAAGKYGSPGTYTVPAGTYSSTSSQLDADQRAQFDVNVNSQAYINSIGTCSSETYSVSMDDYDSTMSAVWITVTCNSSSHPARTISPTIAYKYPVNQTSYITKQLAFAANKTSVTFQVSLTFVGAPTIQSYTIE